MVAKGLYICYSPVIFSLWNSADSKSSSQFETKLVFIMKFYLDFLNGILYYFWNKFLVSLYLKLFVVALFRFCITLISLCPLRRPNENHSIFINALYGERIILHQSFFHKIYITAIRFYLRQSFLMMKFNYRTTIK